MVIKTVAVIGSGVMGSAIAAQIANAGMPVILLDIVPKGASNRNIVVDQAVERLLKAKPAALMHKRFAKSITHGNLEDHLNKLANVDWIIEVIIERLQPKKDLYKKIQSVCGPNTIISSNTSTIPLTDLTASMPSHFKQQFLITHFFNPPRYMRLVEIIAGPKTQHSVVEEISHFCDHILGKSIVLCNDTPGFIANRIGAYWLQTAMLEAFNLGLTVEEADALSSRLMGVPATGIFGLMDLVGLDVMPDILESMTRSLPINDPFHQQAAIPSLVATMIKDGATGRKGNGGFYRLAHSKGKRFKESINLKTGCYSAVQKPTLASLQPTVSKDLHQLLNFKDKGGEFSWSVLSKVLTYSAALVPEVTHDINEIDRALTLGYNWSVGPFELIDKLGTDWFCHKLESDNISPPAFIKEACGKTFYRFHKQQQQSLALTGDYQAAPFTAGTLRLSNIKQSQPPIQHNNSASLWDIGDGVLCLEFHAKMNAIDADIISMMNHVINIIPNKYKALVIYNEAENYSVGANIGQVLFAANIAAWPQINELIKTGQQTYKALKYAPFPVIGAPSGMALGGGCESLLHCDAIQAHAETYMGLVEVGVGLVPAWGGCKEMLMRWTQSKITPKGPMPAIIKAFEIISTASVSSSAFDAQDMLYLRSTDHITMNRERLLFDAKKLALSLSTNYTPPDSNDINLPGETARITLNLAAQHFLQLGKVTPYDTKIANHLANVLSGGETDILTPLTGDQLLALERDAFLDLLGNEQTLDRVQHMLETGKPLRN